MTTRMKQTLGCMSLGLALATFTSSARANLLVDPGFEANPLTTASNVLNNFPTYQGQWGVESATITGVDGGVTPAQGTQMLRMTDDGLVATQAFQVTDVTVYAGLIDSGGATANLSALFNADKNASRFDNDEYKALATEVWQNTDPAKANGLYGKVNDFLLDQQFVSNLVSSAHTYTISTKLKGLDYTELAYLNLDQAELS